MSSLSSAAAPVRPTGPPVRVARLGDELLARQASHGSERAFAALYERYHQPLYRYCRSILRNDADSQDALQSTFTGALQALRRGQRNAPLRPWLYRIAHNEAISLLRRRTRSAADELDAESLGVGGSVEQEAANRARWQALVADLGRLPERQRSALLLRELSGLSHEEIAIALGTSAAGAKQAIFEARQALTEVEEGRAMSCEEVRRRVSEGDRRILRGRRLTAHLHACVACEAFALAIPGRRQQLRAFAPVLAPSAAAAVLSRSMHAASAHGGAGGASAAASTGLAGKAVGTAVLWKGLAAVAVIVTAAAGAAGLGHLLSSSRTAAPAHALQLRGAAAAYASRGHVMRPRRSASSPSAPLHHASRTRHGAADRGTLTSRRAHGTKPRADAATVSGVIDAGAASTPPPSTPAANATQGAPQPSSAPSAAAPALSAGATGSSGASNGRSGSAPGRTGSTPGQSASSPGRSANTPGQGGSSPGQNSTSPGQSANTPGKDGSAPGQGSGSGGSGGSGRGK